MQKPLSKEPIYLTMLKRKSKINDENPFKYSNAKYDLEKSQQLINTQKVRQTYKPDENLFQLTNASKKKPRAPSVSSNALGCKEEKNVFSRIFDASSEDTFAKQTPFQSYFSKTLQLSFVKERTACNRENKILDQPQLVNLKARAINTINSCKADILKEVKLFQENNVEKIHPIIQEKVQKIIQNVNKNQDNNIIAHYEQKIRKLQQKNQQYQKKIQQLELKLSQKQAVASRMTKIQKDLCQLIEQNEELHKLNCSLSKSRLKDNTMEALTQTQVLPLYVKDSFCQTVIPSLELQDSDNQMKIIAQFQNEVWFHRAKHWKTQFQREKIERINKQTQFKTMIQNNQIQNRQKISIIQKQLQAFTIKYQSKCQEVRQKQAIIKKYCFQKS